MEEAERGQWKVTTHDWGRDVDLAHLRAVQESRDVFARGGRRHQILEVLAYADDEAAALGRRGRALVRVTPEGLVSVADDGRGTDTRRDAQGRIIRKPVMATMDVRFFASATPPLLPDGLPRRGLSVVAALSPFLVHENRRDNGGWSQEYRYGVPSTELRELPDVTTTGTTVAFRSDAGDPLHLTRADLTAFEWLMIEYPKVSE